LFLLSLLHHLTLQNYKELQKLLHKWDIMQEFVTNGVINGKSVTNGVIL